MFSCPYILLQYFPAKRLPRMMPSGCAPTLDLLSQNKEVLSRTNSPDGDRVLGPRKIICSAVFVFRQAGRSKAWRKRANARYSSGCSQ